LAACAVAGHRRPGQYGLLAEDDAPIQPLRSAIDPCQHRSHGQQLERAAHQEAFVRAMPDAALAAGIQDRHTQPTTMLAFQCSQMRRRSHPWTIERKRRAKHERSRRCNRTLEKIPTIHAITFMLRKPGACHARRPNLLVHAGISRRGSWRWQGSRNE
jgi:hypothetical protein